MDVEDAGLETLELLGLRRATALRMVQLCDELFMSSVAAVQFLFEMSDRRDGGRELLLVTSQGVECACQTSSTTVVSCWLAACERLH